MIGVPVLAQDTELDPLTVTSSIIPEKISKTGRNVFTIKGEQFSKLPVNSIDELLRFLPGIEMQMRGPAGVQSDISLRGSTFQQVLVILDGMRLNDPNTGHFSSYIPIAPHEIERVEILKGASSSIYGSEAVGGVIHIITKAFAAKNKESKKALQMHGMMGTLALANASLGGLYQKNGNAIGGGFLSNNSLGPRFRGIRGYFHNHTLSASVNHFLNDKWNISFRTAYDSRDFAAQNFYTTFVSDTAREKVNSFWNQFRIGYQKNKSRLSILAGYKSVDDTYQFNSAGFPNKSTSELGQAAVIFERGLNTKLNMVTGMQYQNKSISSNDRGQHSLGQTGIFASMNYKPSKGFTINPSLRVDWIEGIGAELIPQLNLSYEYKKWQMRGSAGKTIRDADFTERFNNYNRPLVTSGRIGNPALEAERSLSYELGADYFASNSFKFSTTFFQRYHKKLIDYVVTPYADMPRKDNLSPTGTYALAKNISEVTTTGLEIDIQFQKTISTTQSFWSTLGFIWLNDNSSSGTPSFYISSHAKYLLNWNTQYNYKWLGFTLSGIYKQRTPQTASAINASISNDYLVMNIKAEAYLMKRTFILFAQVDNIFGLRYQDLLGAQMPQRWIMGGFRVDLK